MESIPRPIIKHITQFSIHEITEKDYELEKYANIDGTIDSRWARSLMCACKKFSNLAIFYYIWLEGRCETDKVYISRNYTEAWNTIIDRFTQDRKSFFSIWGSFIRVVENRLGYEDLQTPTRFSKKLSVYSLRVSRTEYVYVAPFVCCCANQAAAINLVKNDSSQNDKIREAAWVHSHDNIVRVPINKLADLPDPVIQDN